MPDQPLLQILRRPPESSARAEPFALLEKCEFCGAGMEAEHGHMVDLARHAILCVCRPCYLLFTHDGAGGKRFRAIPQRYAVVPECGSAQAAWEALDVPIGLAFFFRSSVTGRTTAFYPSPVGATESELSLESWEAVRHAAPALQTMADDVEGLLVRRTGAATVQALIVPVDACYELVGRIRQSWRGLQGGDDLWRDVDEFFARVAGRAQSAEPAA